MVVGYAEGGRVAHAGAAYDGLLDLFPQSFHEPYFADYMGEDLRALFAAAGLRRVVEEPAFMAKVSVFEKS